DKNKQMIELVYSDNGHGISQQDIEKIYDPFFTTNRSKGNTGLGLSIVYNLVTQTLKGSIKCQSIKNEGTVFTVSFPVSSVSR
ncbi:MAG TPA: HAMP domain-containing sensor histidine kinase, partial [Petrotogaceae bacterium]|nr:HAMP domain-containing sensor histidine kinase [Petrotogaceae bacterium]